MSELFEQLSSGGRGRWGEVPGASRLGVVE